MPLIDKGAGNNSYQWRDISDSSLSADGPRNLRIVGPVPDISLPASPPPSSTPTSPGTSLETIGERDRWVIENTSPLPTIVRPTALNTGVVIVRPNEPTVIYPPNIGGVVVNPGEVAYVYDRPETWSGELIIPDPADLTVSIYGVGLRGVAFIDGDYSGARLGHKLRALAQLGSRREITAIVTGLLTAAMVGWRWSGGIFETRLRAIAGIGGTRSRFRSILNPTARASIGGHTLRTKSVMPLVSQGSIGGSTKQSGYIGKLSAIAALGGFTVRNNVPASAVIFLMHARGYSATVWDARRIGDKSSSTEQVLYHFSSGRE